MPNSNSSGRACALARAPSQATATVTAIAPHQGRSELGQRGVPTALAAWWRHGRDPSPGPAAQHLIGFHRIITIIAITTRKIPYGRWKRQGSSQASREGITNAFITLPDKSKTSQARKQQHPQTPSRRAATLPGTRPSPRSKVLEPQDRTSSSDVAPGFASWGQGCPGTPRTLQEVFAARRPSSPSCPSPGGEVSHPPHGQERARSALPDRILQLSPPHQKTREGFGHL